MVYHKYFAVLNWVKLHPNDINKIILLLLNRPKRFKLNKTLDAISDDEMTQARKRHIEQRLCERLFTGGRRSGKPALHNL